MTATIAVVDDDVRILDAIELVLEAEGWTARTYTTGEAFLMALDANDAPHCLILDPHLQGLNGAAVARAIINGDGFADIPIIVLTARASSSVTAEIVNTGVRAVLTKPISADALIEHVQLAISQDSDLSGADLT